MKSASSRLYCAARLSPPDSDEEQLGSHLLHQRLERQEVVAHVLADRGVRAAARLDGADVTRRQGLVADQELGVLAREDVVRDHAQAVPVAQTAAEREQQRRLAAADRPADADRERPLGEVSRQRIVALDEAAGVIPGIVVVPVVVTVVVRQGCSDQDVKRRE